MAFFALPIPVSMQVTIDQGLASWRNAWPSVQWVPSVDYHLTLRFIGGLPPEALARLLASVQEQLFSGSSFAIDLKGLDCFPPHRDRGVLWIGVHPLPTELLDLQARLELQVQSLGFQPETRPFTPHLTVGRFPKTEASRIMEALPDLAAHAWGRITCDEYVLMKRRSGTKDAGSESVYESLARFWV